MAFNTAIFKQRALSSVVFVLLMLAGLLINAWTFFVLFSIINFGCLIEFQKLIFRIDSRYAKINFIHKYASLLAGWAFIWYMMDFSFVKFQTDIHQYFLVVMIVLLTVTIFSQLFINIKNLAFSLSGLIYISLSWGLMISLRTHETDILSDGNRRLIPIVLIASIWINDTMAYIVGSFIGKTPFSKISPKKTWEGTIGGALLAVTAVTLTGYFICGFSDITLLIAISSIAATTGTLGDLFESKLKRMADVKDSGNIMPGHGGFLDRFDSLLIATPFVYLYVLFFK